MAKRLEKNPKKMKSLYSHEVEVRLFIHHVVKLFPDISGTELRRFIAKHLGVVAGYQWVLREKAAIEAQGFFLQDVTDFNGDGIPEDERVQIEAMVKQGVANINKESQLAVKEIVEDSQKVAKSIKGKMMSEISIRLEGDAEGFSNDELIRGSKTMHEIEHNTPDNPNGNVNILQLIGGTENFNEILNELKRKQQRQNPIDVGAGASDAPDNGEVSKG